MPKITDGRRNNRPPEHGKIKPGEVRNRFGRAGKPDYVPANSVDMAFLSEASRVVSHDKNGPVTAQQRLVQEEFWDALQNSNSAVRARVLAQLSQSSDRAEREQQELLFWVSLRKSQLEDEFYIAQCLKRRPPDILPHPAHVKIVGGRVVLTGPTELRMRAFWEDLKLWIKVAACGHDICRRAYREHPDEKRLQALRAWEAHRRKLRRAVPKGWNWQEEIWCRDSQTEFANEIIRQMKEIGHVDADTYD